MGKRLKALMEKDLKSKHETNFNVENGTISNNLKGTGLLKEKTKQNKTL